jgi:hypothetical protein
LKRLSLIVAIIVACGGCEAILGIGDTTPSAPDGGSDAATDQVMTSDVDGGDGSDPESADTGAGDADAAVDAVDETTDAMSDAPDTGWTPLEVPGLALWLDAAVGTTVDNGRISIWQDRSPNGNSAVHGAIRPLWTPGAIGAYPGVTFEGNGEYMAVADSASMRFGTSDFVVLVVMRHKTSTTSTLCPSQFHYGLVFHKQDAGSPFPGFAIIANFPTEMGSLPWLRGQVDGNTGVFVMPADGMSGFNDNVPRLVGLYRKGAILSVRINGRTANLMSFNGVPPINIDAVDQPATIGASTNGEQCLDGVISEIVAASGVTDDDVTALETYLLAKHSDAIWAALP